MRVSLSKAETLPVGHTCTIVSLARFSANRGLAVHTPADTPNGARGNPIVVRRKASPNVLPTEQGPWAEAPLKRWRCSSGKIGPARSDDQQEAEVQLFRATTTPAPGSSGTASKDKGILGYRAAAAALTLPFGC